MRSVESQVTRLFLFHLAAGVGLACTLGGLFMLGWDGLEWWRNGTWKAFDLSDLALAIGGSGLLPLPFRSDETHRQAASSLIGTVPVSVLIIGFGLIVTSRGLRASDEAGRRLDLLRRLEAR